MAKNVSIKRNYSLLPKNAKIYPFNLPTINCPYIYRPSERK